VSNSYWDGRPVIDADEHPELVPPFMPPPDGPPADALSPHADADIIEPPAWEDPLDVAYGAAEARQALFDALQRRDAQQADPEAGA